MPLPAELRILVIDDDAVMTELLSALLEMEGHIVQTAVSGEEGIATAAISQRIDVILTDLQLPGIRGPELSARLRSACQKPALLLGMSGSEPSEEEAKAFDAFLLKPFTVEQFSEAVTNAAAPSQKPTQAGAVSTHAALDEAIVEKLGKSLKPSQLKQLYDLTLSDVQQRLARIKAADAAGDRETVRKEAHAIKGGCGMVGAAQLYHLAASLETGTPGNTPPLADFDAACDHLRRMLDARFTDAIT